MATVAEKQESAAPQKSELDTGRYWMTFRGSDNQQRRVLVVRDAAGVLRAVWADERWKAAPSVGGEGDMGLRVDQMPDDTRFVLVEVVMNLVVDEQSQVTRRPLRDTDGQAIMPGKYVLSRPGVKQSQVVEVFEDQLAFDLWLIVKVDGNDVRQRIDELSGDCVLERVKGNT